MARKLAGGDRSRAIGFVFPLLAPQIAGLEMTFIASAAQVINRAEYAFVLLTHLAQTSQHLEYFGRSGLVDGFILMQVNLVDERVEFLRREGIPRDDVVFDAVCLASAAMPNSMQVTLDTLKAVHDELGMSTLLGIGNAGFGMPDQTRLDLLYLAIAASWGLDAALVDYRTEHLALYSHGLDFLTGRDGFGQGYLEFVRRSAGRRARRRSRRGQEQV